MTYRSRTDITAQILEAANGGVTKNKIIYKAVLGYDQMNKYLMLLAKSSLLSYDFVTSSFKTTEKGFSISLDPSVLTPSLFFSFSLNNAYIKTKAASASTFFFLALYSM